MPLLLFGEMLTFIQRNKNNESVQERLDQPSDHMVGHELFECQEGSPW